MKILKGNMHFVPALDQKFKTTVFHVPEKMSSNCTSCIFNSNNSSVIIINVQ